MMSENNEPRDLFLAVLALTSAEEQNRYLDQACRDKPELRQRVEILLREHQRAGSFLEEPAKLSPGPTLALNAPVTEKAGDHIGHYKLLEQIGEGGCGVVYMAEQVEPLRRRVALKVIKLGMDTKQVIARFEAERQALALMEHPNIAKVLDAGTTETGRPYFVMELVRGTKITDYCDENRLSTRERLDLFVQVCHAIQHAHQKGIIHRDIKPSNILVTINDGMRAPKVIDFGIVKAVGQQLTDKTVFTAFEQFIGTPAYMSPEQAVMTSLDIDTRSDIYALGVLLYELLTGHTPFEQKDLVAAGLDEMRRIIREQEPIRPSTRLSTLAEPEQTTVAKRRSSEPPQLIHLLRGDLDWIVMKCLEKDRARRYETANGVADDVLRHLVNEPVVARPPSKAYRFQKLVRRNKLPFSAAGAVVAALLVGIVVSTLEAVRARKAEWEQSRLRSQAEASQKKSETEAAKATAISDFLQQMLRSANPDALKGSEYTVRQLLDDFSAGLDNQLKDQPEVEAAVRATIGRAYYRLGITNKAQAHLERALMLQRRLFGEQSESVAGSLVDCAWVCFEAKRYKEGEADAREALDIYRKHGTGGQPVISTLWVLEKLLTQQSRFKEVDAVTEEALAVAGKGPAGECPELASMLHGLAEAKNLQGKYDEAAAVAVKAIEMQRRLRGPEHPETAWALISLAAALRPQHKLTEAEAAGREALRIFRKYYSSGHVSMDAALRVLAGVLQAEGDDAGAEALYRELRAGQGVALGSEELVAANLLHEFGIAFAQSGKWADAESAFRQSLVLKRKLAGNESPTVPWSLCGLGGVFQYQGKLAEAESLFREALGIQHTLVENGNSDVAPSMLDSLDDLLFVLQQQNKPAEAENPAHETTEIILKVSEKEPARLPLVRRLADMLKRYEKSQDAEKLYEEAIKIARRQQGEQSIPLMLSLLALADLHKTQNQSVEAESCFHEALEIASHFHADATNAMTLNNAAWNLVTVGSRGSETVAIELARKAVAATNRKDPLILDTLAAAYAADRQFTNAVSVQQEAIALLKNEEEKKDYSTRLKLYQSNCPYRDHGLLAQDTLALLKEGKFTEAETMARECLALREMQIPDNWRTFSTRSVLGESLLGQKKYAEAAPWLLSGYQGLKQREEKIPAAGKPRLREALQRLVQLYEATNRPDQATEWKQKLAEFDRGEAAGQAK